MGNKILHANEYALPKDLRMFVQRAIASFG